MGILTDFFVAAPEEITAERFNQGPTDTFPTVQSKSFTPVELRLLLQVVRQGKSAAAIPVDDAFPLILTCPSGEAWVIAFPPDLRDALASATEADLVSFAGQWAACEQLRFKRLDEATLTVVLKDMSFLAGQAQRDGKSLYLWMSV